MSRATDKTTWSGAFNTFGRSIEAMTANPAPLLAMLGAYLAIVIVWLNVRNTTGVVIACVLALLYGFVTLLAMPRYALAMAQGKKLSFSEFLKPNLKQYVAIFVAGVLYGLAFAISLLLLIVPVIWVFAWFALYQMTVIDKNLGPIKALKESKRLMQNHKGKMWRIIGAMMLLTLGLSLMILVIAVSSPMLGYLLNAVASMFASILYVTAVASLYFWLKAQPKTN